MRTDVLSRNDMVLIDTPTLGVWIRRPKLNHTNWWIAFCSSNRAEVRSWNRAIERICTDRAMSPFHQGTWPCQNHGCGGHDHYECEDTVHAWELWMACSEEALAFPEDPLEDIRACGDPALERVFEAFPAILAEAERLVLSFGQH